MESMSMSPEQMLAQAASMTGKKVVIKLHSHSVPTPQKTSEEMNITVSDKSYKYFVRRSDYSGRLDGKVSEPESEEAYETRLMTQDFHAREAWKKEHFPEGL